MRLLAVGVAATVGLVAAILWLVAPSSPESEIAARLAGERWYAVTFRHTPIGHYRAYNGRTEDGDFEFRTALRFQLADNEQTRIKDRLVFHRRPPHRLLLAEHSVFTGTGRQTLVTIRAGVAEVVEGGDRRQIAMNDDLELGSYLAVERWLANDAPAPGDAYSARSIDFDRLAIIANQWRIVARDDAGIEIAKAARRDATRVRLDADLVPLRMAMADLFTMQRVADEAAARVWERSTPLFASADHRVPVDRAIANPTALRRLVVAVDNESGRAVPWPDAQGSGLLTNDADARAPATAAEIVRASAATVSYPAADPKLRALAERAVAGLDDRAEMAASLAGFIHGHLRYRDAEGGRTVFDTLRDRSGDCTEFADLYTTLARAVGLPARTVVGLAYRELAAPGFALHAWNEVAIDGVWHGIDPAWGQTRPGAARFALPEDAALAAIAELPQLRFRVLETQY